MEEKKVVGSDEAVTKAKQIIDTRVSVTKTKDIGLLYGALAKAQGTYKKLEPDESSASGPYASLEAILGSVRESLSSNELAFTQSIELLDEGSGAALLITKIGHSSDQEITSTARVYSGNTDRATGITYDNHKRLHAMMLLGVAEVPGSSYGSDNGDSQEEDSIVDVLKGKKLAKRGYTETIDKSQYDQLMIELDTNNDKVLVLQIQDHYGVTTLADLPRNQFQQCLAEIRRVKRTRALNIRK